MSHLNRGLIVVGLPFVITVLFSTAACRADDLLVTNWTANNVLRYDENGVFVEQFVTTADNVGMTLPHSMLWGPDLTGDGIPDLLVAALNLPSGGAVLQFDGVTGDSIGAGDDFNDNGVPDECETVGDTNGDDLVNIADLLNLLAAWGFCGICPEDLNGDHDVGVLDLLALLSGWS